MAGDYHRGPFGLRDRRLIWFVSLDRALPDRGFLMSRRGVVSGSALLAALALAGCDNSQAPPPPVVVVTPDPPPPIVVQPLPVALEFPNVIVPRSPESMSDDTKWLSLTGPLHPMLRDAPGPEWRFPDTANSSSSRLFIFSDKPKLYGFVQWLTVWYPINTNQKARLCYAYTDAVPPVADWLEIARIDAAPRSPGPGYPAGWSVRPDSTDAGNAAASAALNRLAQEGRDIYLGWQIYGDGSPMDLCECRLTMKVLDA